MWELSVLTDDSYALVGSDLCSQGTAFALLRPAVA